MSMAANTSVVEKHWNLFLDVRLCVKRPPGRFTVECDRPDFLDL